RTALQAELAAARSRGYAVTDAELEPGLVAVATPVHRDRDTVVAALSVSGPATRLAGDRITEVAARCIARAAELSAALGHLPSPTLPARHPAPATPAPAHLAPAHPAPAQTPPAQPPPRPSRSAGHPPQREGAA